MLNGDGSRAVVVVAYLGVDVDISTLVADVVVVYEDATASHLILFNSIGDGNFRLGNEPYIAVDTPMIGEVERHLLLAGRVGLVVTVVGLDGDDDIVACSTSEGGEVERDGQVSTFMLHHLTSVDIDGLLAHDSLEVQDDITAGCLLGQREVLAVPGNALIVAASAGLGRHQLYAMRCRNHFPGLVVIVDGLGTGNVA